MAHQWFGDMVTMKWWNNIWLNEGFATWMESKAVSAWKPEWNLSQDEALDLDGVLNYDAGKITRAIRAKADTPGEINEMFDGITYQKGAAVLAMTENYETPEVFRKGVHNYLEAHMYGNATAEDFWNAQTAASGKPIDKVMDSFITEPGVPLLTFSSPKGGSTEVSQQRFFLDPETHADHPQTWTVPVCFREGDMPKCELLTVGAAEAFCAGRRFLFRQCERPRLLSHAVRCDRLQQDPERGGNQIIAGGANRFCGE